MESKNERIKKIFPLIIGMADELYPVYMPTDENSCCGLDDTTLFGRDMRCFSFSTARLCYIAVYRKSFPTAFLMLVRDGLVDIDLSDIKNIEVNTYGYYYETASYKINDLTDGIYDAYMEEEAFEDMEANCSLAMQENDHLHTNVYNLFIQLCQTEWYGQEDIKIWRFSNRWLPEILGRDHDLATGSERMIMDNIFRLSYLLFPDDVSHEIQEYSKKTGDYEFAAVESAYVSTDWNGYNEYWCRLDTAFLNFGALLTIPYIDALLDDVDLCR